MVIILLSLAEILQLDKVTSSVKKIDLFVSQKTKFSNEYMQAIAYKGLVLHELGKNNEALKLLYEYVPDLNKMDREGAIALTSSIIEITLDVGAYDQAIKYIRIKKGLLPISRTNEYIKDALRLYLAKGDYENAKHALTEYLDDDITHEEEIYALEKLANIYYMEKDFDKYLETIPKLESYYTTTLDLQHQEEISKNKIEIAYIRKNYIRVIQDGDSFFKEFDASIDKKLLIAAYMIRCYIEVDNYKKASIVESNYEEFITEEFPKESLEFAKAALDLYIHTNTASSVLHYRRKIEELEGILNPKEEAKKPTKKTKKKEEIVIPTLDDKTEEVYTKKAIVEDLNYSPLGILNPKVEEVPIQSQKVIEDIKSIKNVTVSENYEKLSLIFDSLINIDHDIKFREEFRRASIEISKQYSIDEIYILYFDYKYLGYHYKVERVYDKEPKIEQLEGTLGYQAMQMGVEVFLDQSDQTYSKNIVTGKDYLDDTYGIAMPIFENNREIGSITYISKTPFLANELCYESLKLITKLINARLIEYLEKEKNILKNKKMIFLTENMSSGIIENLDGYYHFSKRAQDILGVFETLNDKDYYMHMDAKDIAKYKEVLKELYALQTMDLSLEYNFKKENKDIRIHERFYPLFHNGMITIYSLIDDITDEAKEKKDLVALAYENPISHMQTEVKLTTDLVKEYPNKKLSLAIIDCQDSMFYKDIYGLNFYNQLIYAIGVKLKDAFQNHFNISIYHLFATTYAILIPNINDKRVVDSILMEGLNKCNMEMKQLNYRVNIYFNCGVFRLGKNMNLDDVSEMISNASDALIDAANMEEKGNHIAHYDSKMAKARFYENHMVTAISEALDQGSLSMMYKQIVNLSGNKILGFYLEISMDTLEISNEEMYRVIRKKNLVPQIEKYMLRMAYSELRLFNNETKAYPRLFIPVSKETLEERYLEAIQTHEKFYKINPKYIVFVVDSIYNTPLAQLKNTNYTLASKDIFDVYRGLCDYLIYDYHGVNLETVPEILDLCKKHNVEVILSNMNEKEDIDIARENGYQYIFGDFYNKRFRMKDLLKGLKKDKS